VGYPLRSFEAAISSWGSANFYSTLLNALRVNGVRVNIRNPPMDVTGLTSSSKQLLVGLGEATIDIEAFAFATPRLGTQGLITFGTTTNTYVQFADEWDLEMSWPEHDITQLSGAPTWRSFMPGGPMTARGRFRARPVSDTALENPFITGTPAALPTLALRYGDSATDETLTLAGAVVSSLGVSASPGDPQMAEYEFESDGAVTPAGTGSLFGTTALGEITWSAGGSAAGAMVVQTKDTATVKTISFADSFLTSIKMAVKVGEATRVSLSVRATGAVTQA
jgi:hypothetical protein